MSKSVGNVLTPSHIFDEYSADAYRYWASRNRFGTDTIFDTQVVRVGKRLCTKLFNASRFVLMQLDRVDADYSAAELSDITESLDIAFVDQLRAVVDRASRGFADFDYATPLQVAEDLFWLFCDDYLELVKARSYGEVNSAERRSAIATLHLGLRVFLRLFAPFLPYVTEEVWSWRFGSDAASGSIHRSPWPTVEELASVRGPEHAETFAVAVELLRAIRGCKTKEKRNLRWPVESVVIGSSEDARAALASVLDDVMHAGAVEEGGWHLVDGVPEDGAHLRVEVALAAEAAP